MWRTSESCVHGSGPARVAGIRMVVLLAASPLRSESITLGNLVSAREEAMDS